MPTWTDSVMALKDVDDRALREFQIAAAHEITSRDERFREGKRRLDFAMSIQKHIEDKTKELMKAVDAVAAYYESIIIDQERFINLRLPSAPTPSPKRSAVPKRSKRR